MPNSNLNMLQTVAEGLGELLDEMVFVGGAVAELYADNPAAAEIRPTLDVDCVVEISTRGEFAILEENLRAKGFQNDTSLGAPICRWVYENIKVDIMPTDSKILGFSNRWYQEGIDHKLRITLPNEIAISIFNVAHYLATKFEAHYARGGNDLRQSHDFEDIIYILDNATDIQEKIDASHPNVKTYLIESFQSLLNNPNITEGIETALPYGSGEESVELVLTIIRQIAESQK